MLRGHAMHMYVTLVFKIKASSLCSCTIANFTDFPSIHSWKEKLHGLLSFSSGSSTSTGWSTGLQYNHVSPGLINCVSLLTLRWSGTMLHAIPNWWQSFTYFEGFLPFNSNFHFTCLVTMCTHACAPVLYSVQLLVLTWHKPAYHPLHIPHKYPKSSCCTQCVIGRYRSAEFPQKVQKI